MIPKKIFVTLRDGEEDFSNGDAYAMDSLELAMEDEEDGTLIAEYQLVRTGKIKTETKMAWDKPVESKPKAKKAKQ